MPKPKNKPAGAVKIGNAIHGSVSDAIAETIAQRRRDVLVALAEFLTTDVARKSIELQMGKPDAKAWAKLSNLIGGSGYDSKEQRIELLTDLFS